MNQSFLSNLQITLQKNQTIKTEIFCSLSENLLA